jgi:hypothetical protein
MHKLDEVFVLRAMFDPDGVEVDIVSKSSKEGKDVDDLGGVGRQVRLVYGGGEAGRRREIECERYILGQVEAGIVQGVFADIPAERVSAGAGRG